MKVIIILAALLATVTAASFAAVGHQQLGTLPLEFTGPESRIVGGEKAQEEQFPYQVGLLVTNATGSSAWCGGSLISKEWVLTAAHCVDQRKYATVYLGATERTIPRQTIISTQFYIHPNYNSSVTSNDIALIYLPVPAVLTKYVEPVVLPAISSSYSLYEGQTVITSGWGRTSDNTTTISDDLFYIFRTVDRNYYCASVYGFSIVLDSNICVRTSNGSYKKSTCNGDSGGPLVVNDYLRTQIGITSFGAASGCEKGYPVVFTRISSYLDWIKEISGVYS